MPAELVLKVGNVEPSCHKYEANPGCAVKVIREPEHASLSAPRFNVAGSVTTFIVMLLLEAVVDVRHGVVVLEVSTQLIISPFKIVLSISCGLFVPVLIPFFLH